MSGGQPIEAVFVGGPEDGTVVHVPPGRDDVNVAERPEMSSKLDADPMRMPRTGRYRTEFDPQFGVRQRDDSGRLKLLWRGWS